MCSWIRCFSDQPQQIVEGRGHWRKQIQSVTLLQSYCFNLVGQFLYMMKPWNGQQIVSTSPQLQLEKSKGEILGVVIVESGWGSILPTVILANMMNGGPAARSGKLSIGDQIMSINNTSLVGLPLATCQGIIKVQRRWRCTQECGWKK